MRIRGQRWRTKGHGVRTWAGMRVVRPACGHPGTHDLHLVRLARDTALGIWRQLTRHLGLKHHLAALQLHHTLVVSWAILRTEDRAVLSG